MKRLSAALALACAAALSAGCDGPSESDTVQPTGPAAASVATEVATSGVAETPPEAAAATVDADGTPAFAALYPGATLVGEAVSGSGAAGPGGIVTFTTEADPDVVIAFYRERAEAAGLSSVMAMNQGEARAYGAVRTEVGANLQVVASPAGAGETSVQLSWSGGG